MFDARQTKKLWIISRRSFSKSSGFLWLHLPLPRPGRWPPTHPACKWTEEKCPQENGTTKKKEAQARMSCMKCALFIEIFVDYFILVKQNCNHSKKKEFGSNDLRIAPTHPPSPIRLRSKQRMDSKIRKLGQIGVEIGEGRFRDRRNKRGGKPLTKVKNK